MTTEILIAINIVATLMTAFWLSKENKAQASVITTLKTQIESIKPFTEILNRFIDPNEVEKLLAMKTKLLEHETEIKRREIIEKTSEQMKSQWQALYEMDLKPKYTESYTEFANFALHFFKTATFPDTSARDVYIKINFPFSGDILINYLNEVTQKPSDQNANP